MENYFFFYRAVLLEMIPAFCCIYILIVNFFLFSVFQRLSNGSIDPDSEVNRVIELQETVEKQNAELTNTRTKMLELNNRFTELEESYTTAQKDSIKSQEQVVKLQRDLREVSGKIILKNRTSEKIGLSLLAVFTYSAKYRKFPNYWSPT